MSQSESTQRRLAIARDWLERQLAERDSAISAAVLCDPLREIERRRNCETDSQEPSRPSNELGEDTTPAGPTLYPYSIG